MLIGPDNPLTLPSPGGPYPDYAKLGRALRRRRADAVLTQLGFVS